MAPELVDVPELIPEMERLQE
ncbi:MAG: hypothetical protein QOE54_6682, partial [Streptosporangiaceae bacterium]|nr:hypothetical protein [Streptosporangiaceae bacterium]